MSYSTVKTVHTEFMIITLDLVEKINLGLKYSINHKHYKIKFP